VSGQFHASGKYPYLIQSTEVTYGNRPLKNMRIVQLISNAKQQHGVCMKCVAHLVLGISSTANDNVEPRDVKFGMQAYHNQIRDLRGSFKIPYLYDDVTQLCRKQADVIRNYDNVIIRAIGQGEARHRKHERLKLGGGQAYDRSSRQ
jgi:hypothetical protein